MPTEKPKQRYTDLVAEQNKAAQKNGVEVEDVEEVESIDEASDKLVILHGAVEAFMHASNEFAEVLDFTGVLEQSELKAISGISELLHNIAFDLLVREHREFKEMLG